MFVTKTFPKYIQEIIFTKVQALEAPHTFTIRGTSGGGTNTRESAYAALEKLQKWVEKEGAELVVTRDGFRDGHLLSHMRYVRIVVEITDPAAEVIENYIKSTNRRGDLYRVPQDRGDFERLNKRRADLANDPTLPDFLRKIGCTEEEYIWGK